MWMRMIRTPGLPSSELRAVVDRYQQEDLPKLLDTRGFLGIALGENVNAGSIGSVTYWEDEEAMRETEPLSLEARKKAEPKVELPRLMLTDRFEVAYAKVLAHPTDAPQPHMRMVRFKDLTAEQVSRACGSYSDDAERLLEETRGVEGITIGCDPEAGTVGIVSFWSNPFDMHEAERKSAHVRESASAAAGVDTPPLVDSFTITVAKNLGRLLDEVGLGELAGGEV